MKQVIKTVNHSGNPLAYATDGASGRDIRSTQDGVIKPGGRCLIDTGIHMKIPNGYEIQVRSRSGLAYKYGVFVLNGIGTIDSDYTGEIKVLLCNLGNEDFKFYHGDRIAQLVLVKVERMELNYVDNISDLDETTRGVNGFGHTGVK